jgi:predicted Zn finger-like uncharacterized protein
MIIVCENCNKKFEINDNLIPERGRLLQCGSCDHQWFFKKVIKDKTSSLEPSIDIPNAQGIQEAESTQEIQIKKAKQTNPIIKAKQLNYYKIFIVFIISIVALIVLIDTFKHQINLLFPNTVTILNNLHESLRDIILFIKDLIN